MLALVASALLLAEPTAPPLLPIQPMVTQAPPLVEATPAQKKEQHQRRKVVLIGAGAALFGVSYGTSVIIAATAEGRRPFPAQVTQLWGLYIPVAGPVVAMFAGGGRDAGLLAVLAIDALTQAAGIALLIIGLALSDEESDAPRAWLVPSVTANGVGANFGVNF